MTIKKRVVKQPPALERESLPLLLDESRTAKVLGVSLSYLRKSRCEGTRQDRTPAPPFVCVGGRRYYRTEDLQAWVDGLIPQQVIGEGAAGHGR